jgi:hypothetical protein
VCVCLSLLLLIRGRYALVSRPWHASCHAYIMCDPNYTLRKLGCASLHTLVVVPLLSNLSRHYSIWDLSRHYSICLTDWSHSLSVNSSSPLSCCCYRLVHVTAVVDHSSTATPRKGSKQLISQPEVPCISAAYVTKCALYGIIDMYTPSKRVVKSVLDVCALKRWHNNCNLHVGVICAYIWMAWNVLCALCGQRLTCGSK